MGLLGAVPNISEGRDHGVIEAVCEAARSAGAYLADVHIDADHHRSVLTLLADPDTITTALTAVIVESAARIDLTSHEGEHPRVGSCDVAPVVPLDSLTPDGLGVDDALRVAAAVCDQICSAGVPGIRYGVGAGSKLHYAGVLRTGGTAGLAGRLAAGEISTTPPGQQLHPTAGITLVGVRPVLIACNVALLGSLDAARNIARRIRERDGGLVGVRALGIPVESQSLVQVSVNIERWAAVGPARVLQSIFEYAADEDVQHVDHFELVGLAPHQAVEQLREVCTAHAIRLDTAEEPSVEYHIRRALG